MKTEIFEIPGPLLLSPRVFGDSRGFFLESFNEQQFDRVLGYACHFVQDNHSRSVQGVLRGLHYQTQSVQGKLVRVVAGRIFDVAVDLRPGSTTFGRHVSVTLDAKNNQLFWIPPGFAHGFLALSESADVQYKATAYFSPQHERSLLWSDPCLGIEWPLSGMDLTLSEKDMNGAPLALADPIIDDVVSTASSPQPVRSVSHDLVIARP